MIKSRSGFAAVYMLLIVVLIVAGGAGWYVWHKNKKSPLVAVANTRAQSSSLPAAPVKTTSIDLTKLPLGDGKVTTTSPQPGYVYSCTSNFRGGGASHAGSWLGDSTWNAETKPTVDGSVNWPNAKVSITLSGGSRIISGNGLPVNAPTGIFPIQPGSTAYQYDRNPNSIQPQVVNVTLPANPTAAAAPGCLGLGVIGYMTNGVALFDALDDGGRDAAAHEIQDKCDGHPQMSGVYHYHSLSSCLGASEGNNQLLGYALDGYGIYGSKDANGNYISNAQLDECHGMTSKVMWNGKLTNIYHYVLNYEYPYSLGCYRGTPIKTGPRA